MDWNEFAQEVHANAVDKGWWDDPKPSFAAQIALMHSELSEALKEYQAGRPMAYHECYGEVGENNRPEPCIEAECTLEANFKKCTLRGDKPEGVAVELADCVLRILDTLAAYGASAEVAMLEPPFEFYALLCHCHDELCDAFYYGHKQNGQLENGAVMHMRDVISRIRCWAKDNDVDMDAVLRAKHEYNKTRP